MKDDAVEIPTLPVVSRWQMRAEGLRGRKERLQTRLRDLSAGLAALLAHGWGDAPEIGKVREERSVVRDELEELNTALPALEEKIVAGRWEALREVARERLIGISRARGSLLNEYSADGNRIEKAARAYTQAVVQANDRYKRLLALETEGAALGPAF